MCFTSSTVGPTSPKIFSRYAQLWICQLSHKLQFSFFLRQFTSPLFLMPWKKIMFLNCTCYFLPLANCRAQYSLKLLLDFVCSSAPIHCCPMLLNFFAPRSAALQHGEADLWDWKAVSIFYSVPFDLVSHQPFLKVSRYRWNRISTLFSQQRSRMCRMPVCKNFYNFRTIRHKPLSYWTLYAFFLSVAFKLYRCLHSSDICKRGTLKAIIWEFKGFKELQCFTPVCTVIDKYSLQLLQKYYQLEV